MEKEKNEVKVYGNWTQSKAPLSLTIYTSYMQFNHRVLAELFKTIIIMDDDSKKRYTNYKRTNALR